ISSLIYFKDGKLLFVGGWVSNGTNLKDQNSTVRIWNVATGKLVRSFGAGLYGGSLALSPDERLLAASSGAEKVLILDARTGQELRECDLNGGRAGVHRLVFAPSGKVLACCGNGIQFFDPATGKRQREFDKENEIGDILFSPDGKFLASVGLRAKKVQLRDVATGEVLQRFGVKEADCLTFSPDGKFLASVYESNKPGTISLWNVATGKELISFKSDQKEIDSIEFSPDGRTLASAAGDQTVKIWDVATGKENQRLKGYRGGDHCMAFAPDGKTLATGGDDWKIRLWDV